MRLLFPTLMIQKIRTAKLPGNCLYSALKLP
nr:MAG TPA: RNA-dependent RNA polymerase [Caudoviricetes sp.]